MVNIIEQDGYELIKNELIKRPRRLGQHVPDIFSVEAEGSGDGVAKESL